MFRGADRRLASEAAGNARWAARTGPKPRPAPKDTRADAPPTRPPAERTQFILKPAARTAEGSVTESTRYMR